MPNHTSNRLAIIGPQDQIEALKKFVRGNQNTTRAASAMDFNKILPVPAELIIEDCSDAEFAYWAVYGEHPPTGLERYGIKDCDNPLEFPWVKRKGLNTRQQFLQWITKERSGSIEMARKYRRNVKKFGHATSETWCIENWGTKWNAYSCGEWENNILLFSTAWSPPIPVIIALSLLFPELELCLEFADEAEDFLGSETWKAGHELKVASLDDWNCSEARAMLERLQHHDCSDSEEEDEEAEDAITCIAG